MLINPQIIQPFDDRREIAIPGNREETIEFALKFWIATAQDAIKQRSRFAVALSGGSTPLPLYQKLSKTPYSNQVDWNKVLLFWSDERTVPPDHPDSNYHSAMICGLERLPIPSLQIFRMGADKELENAALAYEALIKKQLGPTLFDLVMLGLGDDGHTASLFPNTSACLIKERLVAANRVPELKTWRLTLTIPCINQSWRSLFIVTGESKQVIVKNVLYAPRISDWPASQIGSSERKALWIMDRDAAGSLTL